jgi:hypothetical protein
MIDIFFLLPAKGKFLNNFNEQLKQQADFVWRELDGLSLILFLGGVIIGVGFAIYYYTGFNESPGRHYKMKYWGIWGALSFVLTMIFTVAIEYIGIKTNLNTGLTELYWLCAINNALYSAILYLVTSFIWCNAFRTNAYKFFKI